MFENINGIEMTREEAMLCKQTFDMACSEEDGARKLLEANFENGAQIYDEIERGVEEFFTLNAQDVTSDVIREKLTGVMEGMTPAQQLRYLTNVLVAMSYTGSTLHKNDAWTGRIEDCKTLLEALDKGMVGEESAQITRVIPELLSLACSHIESSAVLFVGQPQYEALMEACMESDVDEVIAIAENTREMSIAMAAAIYTLYAHDKLSSLKDQEYTPYGVGVMSACALEIDAAQKSGVWEKIKPLLINASRAALVLLVGGISVAAAAGMGVLVPLGTYTLFGPVAACMVMGCVLGAVVFMGIAYEGISHSKEIGNAIWNGSANVIRVSVSAMRIAYTKMRDWIMNDVVPAMWTLWNKCSDFIHNHVIKPIAARIHKNAGTDEQRYDAVGLKADGLLARAREAANRVMENEQYVESDIPTPVETELPRIDVDAADPIVFA